MRFSKVAGVTSSALGWIKKDGKIGCQSVLMLKDLLFALKSVYRHDMACILILK